MTNRLSIIILQYNRPELTRECLASLATVRGSVHEVIVVDNASTDPEARTVVEGRRDIRFVACAENGGFGKGNNAGAAVATGDLLLFLNNDAVAKGDFITPLIDFFGRRSNAGIAGPRLENADGSLQLSAGFLPSIAREIVDRMVYRAVERGSDWAVNMSVRMFRRERRVEWVTGAALCIRKSLFERLGGFDESFFMFFEDKDLCLRAAIAGSEVWYVPSGRVTHLRGASASESTMRQYRESQRIFYGKHRSRLQCSMLELYLRLHGTRS